MNSNSSEFIKSSKEKINSRFVKQILKICPSWILYLGKNVSNHPSTSQTLPIFYVRKSSWNVWGETDKYRPRLCINQDQNVSSLSVFKIATVFDASLKLWKQAGPYHTYSWDIIKLTQNNLVYLNHINFELHFIRQFYQLISDSLTCHK